MAAYDSQVIDRIMPKLKQFEATTGRRITPAMLESMMRAELGVEADRASENAYRAKGLQLKEQELKDAKSAAKANAIVQIPTTAANLWLTNKALNKPSQTAELINAMKGTGGAPAQATAPAIDLGSVPALSKPGPLVAPGTNTGGQAILAGGGGAIETGGQAALATGATETGSLAAYDASIAAGAAEGVGSTAGTTAGSSILSTVAPPAMGWAVGSLIDTAIEKWSPIGGAKEKSIAGNVAKGAGLGAGVGSVVPVVGTAVGGVIGGVIGGAVGLIEDASVICSELLHQKRISERDRTKCIIFRFRHIPDDLFMAYIRWAAPHVTEMRKGGWRNWIRLPFAHLFINYMIAIQDKRYPSFLERTVWNYAWNKCTQIAHEHNDVIVREVAA